MPMLAPTCRRRSSSTWKGATRAATRARPGPSPRRPCCPASGPRIHRPEAGDDHVRGAAMAAQPIGDALQQRVADQVTVRIADDLEAVEINEEQPERRAGARAG